MRKITWEEVDALCDKLARELVEAGLVDTPICGVARGGLVPAVVLSHKTGAPLTANGGWSEMFCGSTIIIVDDINDTGRTISQYNYSEDNRTVVLFERTSSSARAQFVGEVIDTDEWLLFPWEQEENAQRDKAEYLDSRAKWLGESEGGGEE